MISSRVSVEMRPRNDPDFTEAVRSAIDRTLRDDSAIEGVGAMLRERWPKAGVRIEENDRGVHFVAWRSVEDRPSEAIGSAAMPAAHHRPHRQNAEVAGRS